MPQKPHIPGAILIVDDCSDDAILTQYALKKLNMPNAVRIVPTAEEMMRYMEGTGCYGDRDQFPYPAIIILDYKLPQMSGLQAQAWLRSSLKHRRIPIIMISTDLRRNLLETAVKCGADGYLVKPINRDDIQTLLRNINLPLPNDVASQDS